MIITIGLDKKTKNMTFYGINVGSGTTQLIDYNNDYVLLKHSGGTAYVDSQNPRAYIPSCYGMYKLIKINNYVDRIDFTIDYDSDQAVPVRSDKHERIINRVEKDFPQEDSSNENNFIKKLAKGMIQAQERYNEELLTGLEKYAGK